MHGYEGFGTLAPVGVGDGDDGGFEDGGVGRELRFEGYGGDVFAACGEMGGSVGVWVLDIGGGGGGGRMGGVTAYDYVFCSVKDLGCTVGMPDCEIACVKGAA